MNFLSMKYFTAVARARSFTRAAAELHITQQTLSAHIAGVEKELGCPLLLRHVPLELTYAGEVFLRYAAEFQKSHDRMMMEIRDITEKHSGVMKVGVGFTRGKAIMPTLIRAFQEQWPNYEVQLVEASNEELRKLVAAGSIDLAIAAFPSHVPEIELRPFYREEIVLAISHALLEKQTEGHAKEAAAAIRAGDYSALRDCPVVMGKPEDISGAVAQDFILRNGLNVRVKARSDNISTLLSLCLLGVGACFCQENFIRMTQSAQSLSGLELFRLSEDASYEILFGIPKLGYRRRAVSSFMEIAQEAISGSKPRAP